MRKEDYQSNNNSIPVDLEIIPEHVSVLFEEKLKLQVAFYRGFLFFYSGSKICKTAPAKFAKSDIQNGKIALKKEKLSFCTTVTYDPVTKGYGSKVINAQFAFQTETEKATLDAKIDIKHFFTGDEQNIEKSGLTVTFRNDIKLFYGIKAKISNSNSKVPESYKTIAETPAISPLKSIRDKSTSLEKRNEKHERSAHRTKTTKIITFKVEEKENDDALSNGKLYIPKSERMIRDKQWEKQSEPDNESTKNKMFNEDKLGDAIRRAERAEEEVAALRSELKRSENLCEEKEKETLSRHKSMKELQTKQRDQDEKTKQTVNEKQKEIDELEKTVKKLKSEKEKLALEKEKLSNQLSETNGRTMGKNNEDEVMQKNKEMERYRREIEELKESNSLLKRKNEEIKTIETEIKARLQESEKNNLALTSQLSENKYELEKCKKEEEKLLKKITKLEQELKELDEASKSSGGSNKNQDIQALTKQLESKEEMIRMLKKEGESKKKEQDEDISYIKKQNKELKEEIDKLKNGKNDTAALELKIQNEKLKKENVEAKRDEKKLISERAEVESRNKEMQEELVKLKETIARILNTVQEQGDEELFTLVADCIA